MPRLPLWLQTTIGVALLAFGIIGVTNSVHALAKIVYAVLIAASTLTLVHAYRRSRA